MVSKIMTNIEKTPFEKIEEERKQLEQDINDLIETFTFNNGNFTINIVNEDETMNTCTTQYKLHLVRKQRVELTF